MTQTGLIEKFQYVANNNLVGIAEHIEREVKAELAGDDNRTIAAATLECLAIDLTYLALHNQDWQASTTYRAFAANYLATSYQLSFHLAEQMVERATLLLPPSHSRGRSRIATERQFVEQVILNRLTHNVQDIRALGLGPGFEQIVNKILRELQTATGAETIKARDNLLSHISQIAAEVMATLEADPRALILGQLSWILSPVFEGDESSYHSAAIEATLTTLLDRQQHKGNTLGCLRSHLQGQLDALDHEDRATLANHIAERLIQSDYLVCLGSRDESPGAGKTAVEFSPKLHRLLGPYWLKTNLTKLEADSGLLHQTLCKLPSSLQAMVAAAFNFDSSEQMSLFLIGNADKLSDITVESLMKRIALHCQDTQALQVAASIVNSSSSPWTRRAICRAFADRSHLPAVRQFLESVASSEDSPSVQDTIVRILSLEGRTSGDNGAREPSQ